MSEPAALWTCAECRERVLLGRHVSDAMLTRALAGFYAAGTVTGPEDFEDAMRAALAAALEVQAWPSGS